jgi:cytosine permease
MSIIETEGVDIVPEENRTRGFLGVFTIWAGFSIVITNFLLGSLVIGAGLTAGITALIISLLLIGGIVYLGTRIAATEGTAGTTAMRAAFGINGRVIPSLAMVLAGVGWFGVQTGIVASSSQQILSQLFGVELPFWGLAAVLGVLMASIAVLGYESIEWLNRIAVPLMTLLVVLVGYQIVTNYSLAGIGAGGSSMSFWAALNVFPAATAAYLLVSMDYGRYGTPADPSKPALGATVAWIGFATVLAIVGLIAAGVAGTWNPVQITLELGLGWVGLLLLIFGSWTTNITNVYAGGIALSQITGVNRFYMTIATGLLGTALVVAGIFSFGGINSFLTALTITLVPTTGVLLTHYFLFEKSFDADELFNRGGKYWYLSGWHPAAVLAWAVGALYAIWANGLLAAVVPAVGSAEFLVPGLSAVVVSGGIYYVIKSPVESWIEDRAAGRAETAD